MENGGILSSFSSSFDDSEANDSGSTLSEHSIPDDGKESGPQTANTDDSSQFNFASRAVRRRGRQAGQAFQSAADSTTPGRAHVRSGGRRRRRRPSFYEAPSCSTVSTVFLAASLITWIAAPLLESDQPLQIDANLPVRERIRIRTNRHRNLDKTSIVDHVAEGFRDFADVIQRKHREEKKKKTEDVPEGCKGADWQEYIFPNCNDVHDIDLRDTLMRATKHSRRNVNGVDAKLGYLDKGFWRSVWAVRPSALMEKPAVLKMMLKKHDTDKRNFDRHRRDALVMERLTASPNVVDIYGFCGNTVLTEYIPTPLDSIVSEKARKDLPLSRDTPLDRLKLALGAAKGLKALHEIDGGPVIHADIQARQFLVTSEGTVKINDFNRCRFMTRSEKSGEPCKMMIPSAPGKSRSPEEYKKAPLDEQLDIYSIANVYYSILTGMLPYSDYSTKEVQNMVKKGIKPSIPSNSHMRGTTDDALVKMTVKSYEKDPRRRPTAGELVRVLEEAANRHE